MAEILEETPKECNNPHNPGCTNMATPGDHREMCLDAEDAAIVEWYRASGESDSGSSDDELDKLEAMTGQGGITVRAIDYIGEQLPEGWVLNVETGEYTVLQDWVECSAEGNGCEVDTDASGNVVLVKRCPDHNPCEGHSGEDADLTNPNVGIGETTYCDGSCVTGRKEV